MTFPYLFEAPGKVAHLYLYMNIYELKVAESLSRHITVTVGVPTGAHVSIMLYHRRPAGLKETLYEKSSYFLFSIISWSSIKLLRCLRGLERDLSLTSEIKKNALYL